MKRKLILLTVLFLLVPGLVFSDMFTFKVGYFIPRGSSDLWQDEFDQMDFKKSNFQNTNFSFAYEYFLAPQLSVVLGLDNYSKNKLGSYIGFVAYQLVEGDFAFPDDYEGEYIPAHVFSVSITPIHLSLKLTPTGRRNKITPYIGGGIGLYIWNVKLYGNLIDFSEEWYYEDPDVGDVPIYPIWSVDAREENRLAIGYHVFGGIMMPIARRITLDIEFKFNAAKGNFSEDSLTGFEGFEPFDLGGYQISAGINYWF